MAHDLNIDLDLIVFEWLSQNQGALLMETINDIPFKKDHVVSSVNKLVRFGILSKEIKNQQVMISFTKDWTELKLIKLMEWGIPLEMVDDLFKIPKKIKQQTMKFAHNVEDIERLESDFLAKVGSSELKDENESIKDHVVLILEDLERATEKGSAKKDEKVKSLMKKAKVQIQKAKKEYQKSIKNAGAEDIFYREDE